jgi:hypothetical protein
MSANRTLHFDKHIRNQPTPEAYLRALADSPYRTHKRMAVALQEHYQQLNEMRDNEKLDIDTNKTNDSRDPDHD